MSLQPAPRPCRVLPNKLSSGRKQTEADKLYASLTVLGTKAECDTQYDVPVDDGVTTVENYIDYRAEVVAAARAEQVKQEAIRFLIAIAVGVAAVSFWRSAR